jgi:hypothetical protein
MNPALAVQSEKAGMHQGVGKGSAVIWLVQVVPDVHIVVPCGGEPRCLERDKPVAAEPWRIWRWLPIYGSAAGL